MAKFFTRLLFIAFFLLPVLPVSAQDYLLQKVSIHGRQQPVSEVLQEAAKQGGFYFSYKSDIINDKQLVDISISGKQVAYLLNLLFQNRFRYEQKGKYLIIQLPENIPGYINGVVTDRETGQGVCYATVYEERQLVSAMTDESGRFHLRLKDKTPDLVLGIRKISYRDTTIKCTAGTAAPIFIRLEPKQYVLDSVQVHPYSGVEQTWLAGLFLSSRQTLNSLNLSNFLATRPYQFSLLPGLGSHNKMGAQVINKFSFNLLGGYTAGVNGFELGSLFNIAKQNMGYLQIAGLFNMVGGDMNGVQIAGLHNRVMAAAVGVQVSGLAGSVKQQISGVQVGGLYNKAGQVSGFQLAGILNVSSGMSNGFQLSGLFNKALNADGMQLAGLVNWNKGVTKGMQLSAGLNYAKDLKGVQFGLVNIAEESTGYNIGLVNIVPQGYHKLSLAFNEEHYFNVAFKSGNPRLYNILTVGLSLTEIKAKQLAIGYGLGREIKLYQHIRFNPEITGQYYSLGNWKYLTMAGRLELNLNIQLGRSISLFAGPAFSVGYTEVSEHTADRSRFRGWGYAAHSLNDHTTAWLGWSAGVSLF